MLGGKGSMWSLRGNILEAPRTMVKIGNTLSAHRKRSLKEGFIRLSELLHTYVNTAIRNDMERCRKEKQNGMEEKVTPFK